MDVDVEVRIPEEAGRMQLTFGHSGAQRDSQAVEQPDHVLGSLEVADPQQQHTHAVAARRRLRRAVRAHAPLQRERTRHHRTARVAVVPSVREQQERERERHHTGQSNHS